jgi:hypothetical protein
LFKTAATLTREIKPCDKVSSFRGANTLLQGQQINGHTEKTQKTEKKETHREERNRREITERDHRTDHRSDQRRGSKEIQGPEQSNQDRSETKRQRVRAHCKKML